MRSIIATWAPTWRSGTPLNGEFHEPPGTAYAPSVAPVAAAKLTSAPSAVRSTRSAPPAVIAASVTAPAEVTTATWPLVHTVVRSAR